MSSCESLSLWCVPVYRCAVIPLPGREVHRIRHMFDTEHLALVVDAVAAGNSPAQVWADSLAEPRAALVWDGAHGIYFAGSLDQAEAWQVLFRDEIAPAGRGIFKLYATEAAATAVLAGHALHPRERVFYRGGQLRFPDWPLRLPAGFQISAINDRFCELDALSNFDEVIAEIESCWNSVADFRRAGFGYCAHDAETIVSWCTAEYVSEGRCGIGIETVAAYGGRGFATLTASAFVEHCAERGVTPHWDCWTSNLPSVAIAEKLGFHKLETYSIFVGDFGAIQPQAHR
jgi:RimJ/RimL family protein N-acetyltransferase